MAMLIVGGHTDVPHHTRPSLPTVTSSDGHVGGVPLRRRIRLWRPRRTRRVPRHVRPLRLRPREAAQRSGRWPASL
jgi:hypothetical protein